jgi:HEAT repeat protein
MVAVSMKKRANLLLLIPLGAGLIFWGGSAFDPPGAEWRPAPYATFTVNGEALSLHREVDLQASLASIDIDPAKDLFLQTVVLQGTAGDKKAAILELRKLGTSEAIATLSLALGDDDPRVRKSAFEALTRIGGDDALAAIASASQEDDPLIRLKAAEALGIAGGYSAAAYLELALRDEDERVRTTAVEALGDLGDSRSVNIISVALRDENPEVRQRAAELLDQLSDETLFQTLYPPL